MPKFVVPKSRSSREAWFASCKNSERWGVDTFIASHVWDTEDYKMEPFGGSPNGDDVQARLQTFLDRNEASWSDQPSTRKARWSESALIGCILGISS